MRRRQIDPSLLEGEELDRWYRRPFDEVEAEREADRVARYDAFFAPADKERSSDLGAAKRSDDSARSPGEGWQEARVVIRPPGPTTATSGVRIGIPAPLADIPDAAPSGGFFDSHRPIPNPTLGPAYITDLPSPLNVVTPKLGGWFELGDGTLVKGADEVERIYAEQQRLMNGVVDQEPPAQVRTADRFRDGFIPTVEQIEEGQREKDSTCHPYGGWERDPGFKTNFPRSQRYETQIGRAPGLDYVVRNPGDSPVRFDGCAVWDPRHPLLEAKGPGYANIIKFAGRSPASSGFAIKTQSQAKRQANAARGRLTEWHVAEPEAAPYFAGVLGPYPSMHVVQTPAR